jgi:hypothetical protein
MLEAFCRQRGRDEKVFMLLNLGKIMITHTDTHTVRGRECEARKNDFAINTQII